MKSLKFIIFLLIVVFISCKTIIAQVTISPTAVFLDRNSQVGTFYVSNPSNTALEVRLTFEFAYPTAGQDGQVYLEYDDEETESRFSLIPYLRAFPTTFVVPPNGRQAIRLIGRMPQNAENGLYWTRMRVSSNQVTPPVGTITDGEVAAQVSFQFDQVTAVFAHHGSVTTGLQIQEITSVIENGNLTLLTEVLRTGNSAFIGSVRTYIMNSSNQIVRERSSSTSVYFRNWYRTDFDIGSLPPGNYTAVTTFESRRSDIASQNLIQIPTTSERTTFNLE